MYACLKEKIKNIIYGPPGVLGSGENGYLFSGSWGALVTGHPSGKSQGNLVFLQGQGKVREFSKMVREIRKSSKVREKSGNFKIMLG